MAIYEPVIGLEIHAELNTKTKMFCGCANDPNEAHPNMNICPICMAHPGTLPTANGEAVKKVIAVGLALDAEIPVFSQFDRKNYFYPDLPKGYQISQYQHPLVQGGSVQLSDGRVIRITRVHLEEDTGRLIHDRDSESTLVDFNRAGVPLMELVTEPDFRTGEEVRWFGEELQRIVRYVGASDADMEKGQMRVEVNISLRKIPNVQFQMSNQIQNSNDQIPLGTKVEVKNINSFKFAADAVQYEIKRQSALLERGEKIIQETRGWNDHTQETFSQRVKESAHDYRYFPEPDLPPLSLSREMVDEIRATVPELPAAKRVRFTKEYGLDADSVALLVREKSLADYFEAVASELGVHEKETSAHPRRDLINTAVSLMRGDFLRLFRETFSSARDTLITPENFAELTVYFAEDKISNLVAKQILEEMFRTGEDPSDLIEKHGLWQISNAGDLDDIVAHVMKENESAVADVRKGKDAALQFLLGQVMRASRGKANPQMVQELLKKYFEHTT